MIVNTAQGGGGSLPLNLHVQPDEPAVKEGLWIKAPAKETVKQIITKDSFVIGGEWSNTGLPFNPVAGPQSIWISQFYIYDGCLYWLSTSYQNNSSNDNVYLYLNRYNLSTKVQDYHLIKAEVMGQGYYYSNFHMLFHDDNIYCYFVRANSFGLGGTFGLYCPVNNFGTMQTCTNPFYSQGMSATIFIGGDDTTDYYTHKSGSQVVVMSAPKDFSTHTIIWTYETGNSNVAPAGVYLNGKVYITFLQFNLYEIDVSTKVATQITVPTSTLGCSILMSSLMYPVYQNTIYMQAGSNVRKFIIYNTVAQTFSTIDYPTDITQFPDYAILLTTDVPHIWMFNDSKIIEQYSFTSETLDANTLALLDGAKYNVKLISSTAMNFLRTVFNDAWWYDTSFHEYPTYIGNGTAFTKIKN